MEPTTNPNDFEQRQLLKYRSILLSLTTHELIAHEYYLIKASAVYDEMRLRWLEVGDIAQAEECSGMITFLAHKLRMVRRELDE